MRGDFDEDEIDDCPTCGGDGGGDVLTCALAVAKALADWHYALEQAGKD